MDGNGGRNNSIGVVDGVLIYISSSSFYSWYILGLLLDVVELLGGAVILGEILDYTRKFNNYLLSFSRCG
jgi:uncharacterized protein (DUF779 family)